MTTAEKPARNSVPETTPTSAQLEAATPKSAIARTKARNAKAALKNAKKTFKLARKAAKAARKKAEALRKAIARAEEAAPPARVRGIETASRGQMRFGSESSRNLTLGPPGPVCQS